MLTIDGVTIRLQNFGSVYGIFLEGQSKEAIEQRHWSFFNHGITGGELEWWSDTVALFWIYQDKKRTAPEKLLLGLIRAELWKRIGPDSHTAYKHVNAFAEAAAVAQQQFDSIEHVTWLEMTKEWDMYDWGESVTAEKGTGNFDDDVLGRSLSRAGGVWKTAKTEDELSAEESEELDEEPESVS